MFKVPPVVGRSVQTLFKASVTVGQIGEESAVRVAPFHRIVTTLVVDTPTPLSTVTVYDPGVSPPGASGT